MALVITTLVASSLMSAAVYMGIEKPCMNLRERCSVARRA
jgi:peptidoglycan/LPS O-acetylase OafA/YrhL